MSIPVDRHAILSPEQRAARDKAMRVRNALLELLRAWEEQHDLPRAVPTKVERGEAPARTEHHNR